MSSGQRISARTTHCGLSPPMRRCGKGNDVLQLLSLFVAVITVKSLILYRFIVLYSRIPVFLYSFPVLILVSSFVLYYMLCTFYFIWLYLRRRSGCSLRSNSSNRTGSGCRVNERCTFKVLTCAHPPSRMIVVRHTSILCSVVLSCVELCTKWWF